MAKYRIMNNKGAVYKNHNRPKKKPADRARRLREQQKRLIALGVPEAVVAKLNPKDARTLLKRPAKLLKLHAAAAAQ